VLDYPTFGNFFLHSPKPLTIIPNLTKSPKVDTMSQHTQENKPPRAKPSNENTPLLYVEPAPIDESTDPLHADENAPENEVQDVELDIPLPRTQIFLLCYTAVVEPIAFFGIFPYINFMIENVGGVEKADVGFYSGLIESLFSATQMCVMLLWGKVCIASRSTFEVAG
jgi:hypothetical protein